MRNGGEDIKKKYVRGFISGENIKKKYVRGFISGENIKKKYVSRLTNRAIEGFINKVIE